MPAFQSLTAKRPSDGASELSQKRIKLDSGVSHGTQSSKIVWMVQWRNPQYKKHKTWDGDGVLVVDNSQAAVLFDLDGKSLGTGKVILPLSEGQDFSFASKDIELDRQIPVAEYLSGACFGNGIVSPFFSVPVAAPSYGSKTARKAFAPPNISLTRSISTTTTPEATLSDVTNQESETHWIANWRKPNGKKNKTWEGDVYISHIDHKLVMISEKGAILGTSPLTSVSLKPGFTAFISGKEIQLDSQIPKSQLPGTHGDTEDDANDTLPVNDDNDPENSEKRPFIAPTNFYAPAQAKQKKGPLHDPEAPDALVMKAPTKEHMKKYNRKNLAVVPVVVDPILTRKLRPHQREGVAFMYECVMELRKHEGQGCILADDMGLGKTLQTITLVWTVLKQNPYASPVPIAQKVLIVCPVSLINNWKAEFHKWLGRDRVGIITCDKNSEGIDLFGRSKVHQVLIIGYERLRTVTKKLTDMFPPIGLIICDEGHRLKSSTNKTATMFKEFTTRRRIILSGTPIQNDLGEFHSMAEFCNPGLLDDYSVFRRVYETPIIKSREPNATQKEIEVGNARTEQLLSIARSFVLRRDAALLKSHLPPKTEYVVFVTPTALQLNVFSKMLSGDRTLDDLIQGSTADSLAMINTLTKISNSPILIKATYDNMKKKKDSHPSYMQRLIGDASHILPDGCQMSDMTLSGKLIVLARMLKVLKNSTEEKCVIVSHYTSTLNILEGYCRRKSFSYFRLDGQTPQNKRQEYVNAYNKGNQQNSFVFLLSSKAGGVGINLIGGSRLIIFDSDWNPSHDLQSMARCHRDGQKRPVFIYRFLTTGTIDEKIYQRQVTKVALSDSLIGSASSSSKADSFTRKDLRDIFRVHSDTSCNTHDLLECGCCSAGSGREPELHEEKPTSVKERALKGFMSASNVCDDDISPEDEIFLEKKKMALASLSEWRHLECINPSDLQIGDPILQTLVETAAETSAGGNISFLFEKCNASVEATGDEEE
ncbi:SNF2 family N-terminal domain-containing protein [Panaeolus papilionaceus]|nr:SNF2 family N-terminal domain-containing protein [Panaeolus papilionaceus]